LGNATNSGRGLGATINPPPLRVGHDAVLHGARRSSQPGQPVIMIGLSEAAMGDPQASSAVLRYGREVGIGK
jgi:hypothetical protein